MNILKMIVFFYQNYFLYNVVQLRKQFDWLFSLTPTPTTYLMKCLKYVRDVSGHVCQDFAVYLFSPKNCLVKLYDTSNDLNSLHRQNRQTPPQRQYSYAMPQANQISQVDQPRREGDHIIHPRRVNRGFRENKASLKVTNQTVLTM